MTAGSGCAWTAASNATSWLTITGGANLSMHEVSEAAKIITASADPNAKVIFGATINEAMKDEIKITVVATGFEERQEKTPNVSVLASGKYTPSSFVKNKEDAGREKEKKEAREANAD